MDKTKIKELLEGLDCRLALGQIDLGTYQTLKAKFSSQIEAQDGPPLEAAVSAMSVQAVALKCPGCMASLLPPPDPEQTRVKCEYCGGTFVLQTAANEVERLRGDVRKWIAEVAGQSSSGSVIDEASRQFIFRDKLWPQLKVTTDRATELYQITRYLPLFTFPLLDHLGSSPFHDALVLTPDVTNFVDRLKSIVAQIQAPELLPFTVGERDKNNLHMLEVSCMEIAHLSNVRHSLITYDTEGLCRTRANLRALGELYSAAGKNSAAFEPSYAKFTHAMANRVSAVDKAIEVLTGLLRPGEGVVCLLYTSPSPRD